MPRGPALDAAAIRLGGAAKRKVSSWANPDRNLAPGPALDDEALPP